MPTLRRLAPLAAVCLALTLPAGALAAGHPAKTASTAGNDISYPQCGGSYPSGSAFGIVGVNDGIVYSANPCLASELSWAQATGHPAFYANTADPGPAVSTRWPTGQTAGGQYCDGSNSLSCSYVYGYLAAQDSFKDAAAVTTSAAALPWWLDVETGNSWETLESQYGQTTSSQQNDTAALQGAVAGLQAEGVASVGFYSTGYQWGQITGGAQLTGPDWVAGFRNARAAADGCTPANSFSGGAVALTQYPAAGYDADHAC